MLVETGVQQLTQGVRAKAGQIIKPSGSKAPPCRRLKGHTHSMLVLLVVVVKERIPCVTSTSGYWRGLGWWSQALEED